MSVTPMPDSVRDRILEGVRKGLFNCAGCGLLLGTHDRIIASPSDHHKASIKPGWKIYHSYRCAVVSMAKDWKRR